jgi:HK97 family phage major capsid protein/HK97 family phage prohead protease
MPTLKTGPQYRHFSLDRDALDTEARTVALAFSSEAPYERYFGTEVLDHDSKSIRLARLTNGGPLLVDHDPTDHIGVIEGVEIGQDKVGRALVRFGKSARAQEVFQDVQDGIRRHISVGYVIHKLQAEKSGDAEVMRAVDWEPLEVSIVSVPADPTVGIGRSATLEIETEVLGRDEPEAEAEGDIEVPAAPVVEDAGVEVRENAVIEVVEITAATPSVIQEKTMSQIDLSSTEVKKYSYARAIEAALHRAEGQSVSGFEVEVSQDIERALPANTRSHGGIYVPLSLQRVAISEALYNTANKGAETVFTEPGELIDMLRNQSAAVRLGARVMGGLMGPVSFPKQASANTAYWMPENDGTDVTAGNATLGSVTLTPKTLQATTAYSRQLVAQSTLDVEQFIRADLAAVHALAWDKAVFHGAGSSNEPDGLYHISGTNSVAMGGVPTFAKLIDMITEVNKDNALGGNLAFVTTPGMAGKLAQTLVASAAGSNMIWSGNLVEGNLAGFRAVSTNQILATLGGGSEHGLLFGDWSQTMIGQWGAMEIIVDPYAKKKQGMLEITSFQMCDIAFRHTAAYCKATGATIA